MLSDLFVGIVLCISRVISDYCVRLSYVVPEKGRPKLDSLPPYFISCPLYEQVPLPEEEKAELEAKPEKLAIGVEGGFQTDAERFAVEKTQQLVVVSNDQLIELSLPAPDLPEVILNSIAKITVRSEDFLQALSGLSRVCRLSHPWETLCMTSRDFCSRPGS
jgi:hypothetical protein